jgi:predicted RNA-binding protein YlxR (DUF448 family)
VRTCAGCRVTGERGDLLRFVVGDDGTVVADLAATTFGRGAWVHPRASCLVRAAASGLARASKRPVNTTPEALVALVTDAASRRVEGLLASARASGQVAVGTDAVRDALAQGKAALVVVAGDARASAAELPSRAGAFSVVWGNKITLGAAVGRGETGVVAILDRGFGDVIARGISISTLSLSDASNVPESFPACQEVR